MQYIPRNMWFYAIHPIEYAHAFVVVCFDYVIAFIGFKAFFYLYSSGLLQCRWKIQITIIAPVSVTPLSKATDTEPSI